MPYKDKEKRREHYRQYYYNNKERISKRNKTPESRRKAIKTRKKWMDPLEEFIHYFKEHNPCVDCGNYFPHYVMEFDHVRGIKNFPVSAMMALGWDRVIEEIEKCDLVCGNCHNIRTYTRKQWGVKENEH